MPTPHRVIDTHLVVTKTKHLTWPDLRGADAKLITYIIVNSRAASCITVRFETRTYAAGAAPRYTTLVVSYNSSTTCECTLRVALNNDASAFWKKLKARYSRIGIRFTSSFPGGNFYYERPTR